MRVKLHLPGGAACGAAAADGTRRNWELLPACCAKDTATVVSSSNCLLAAMPTHGCLLVLQVCIYKGFCVKNGNFAIIMKLYSYSLAHRVSTAPGEHLGRQQQGIAHSMAASLLQTTGFTHARHKATTCRRQQGVQPGACLCLTLAVLSCSVQVGACRCRWPSSTAWTSSRAWWSCTAWV